MKKLITILAIMMVLVGVAFAATRDQLKVTAVVDPTNPEFTIYGSASAITIADTSTTIEGSANAAENNSTIATEFDPSIDTDENKAKGTVYVRVYQNNQAKTAGICTLSLTGTALANTQTANADTGVSDLTSYKTAVPAAANVGIKEVSGIATSSAVDSNKITYTLNYAGTNVDATTISVASFTWTPLTTLPVGTYAAYITLEYATQN